MRAQRDIQLDMTNLIQDLAKLKPADPNITINEAMGSLPEFKSKWEVLMAEAEELRSKGVWKSQS